MKLQIIGPDGHVKCSTESVVCFPDEEQLKSMSSAGYKFRLDGKTAKYADVLKARTASDTDSTVSGKLVIRCITTGEVFSKQSEAAKKYGIDPAAVSDSIKSKKVRSGYLFEKIYV